MKTLWSVFLSFGLVALGLLYLPGDVMAAGDPIGFVEAGTGCSAFTGWTCDPDNYNSQLRVDFHADVGTSNQQPLGSITANLDAQNPTDADAIAAACGGNRTARRYSFNIPSDKIRDGRPHDIYAYAINVGTTGVNTLLPGANSSANPRKFVTCAAVPTPTPAPRMTLTGNCSTWNTTVPGNTQDLELDFFLDRSQNPDLGIKDSVGGENGGHATYYLGGTTISGTSKSIDLRRELLNHDSLNPESDSRNPKEVLYQGKAFKVTAYAHTPDWAAIVGSDVFNFPACNLETGAPVAAYTTAPQSGCQAAVGTYNDPDYPNGIDGGEKQVDLYIMNSGNQAALSSAGAKYEDGTPVSGNIYLGFARPNKEGNWTFDPNRDTLKTTDFYRTLKQYNPYNILFTDPSKPVSYKITSFAVGINALGNRADGLATSGVPNFNLNSEIPGNYLLSCQGAAPTPAPIPSCLETGNFSGKGPHDLGNFDVWKDAFTRGLRGLPASISNCSGMAVDLKAFNAWRRKDLGL